MVFAIVLSLHVLVYLRGAVALGSPGDQRRSEDPALLMIERPPQPPRVPFAADERPPLIHLRFSYFSDHHRRLEFRARKRESSKRDAEGNAGQQDEGKYGKCGWRSRGVENLGPTFPDCAKDARKFSRDS
jgi:hypothetical protein